MVVIGIGLYYIKVALDFVLARLFLHLRRQRLATLWAFTLYLAFSGFRSLVLGPLWAGGNHWHGWLYWRFQGVEILLLGWAAAELLKRRGAGMVIASVLAAYYFALLSMPSRVSDAYITALIQSVGMGVCAACVVAVFAVRENRGLAAGLLIGTLFGAIVNDLRSILGPDWIKLAAPASWIVAQCLWLGWIRAISEAAQTVKSETAPQRRHRHLPRVAMPTHPVKVAV